MFTSIRRHKHHNFEIWPGFVDALATLLMVITFVLMTFVVAQLYLSDALNTKDQTLHKLNSKLELMTRALGEASEKNTAFAAQTASLETLVAQLNSQVEQLQKELALELKEKQETQENNKTLLEKINTLHDNIARLTQALEVSESTSKNYQLTVEELREKLNKALLEKVEELKKLNEELDAFKLNQEKNKDTLKLAHYRSEFFSKLRQAIGHRSDIRIVGDRFVFQSELFFEKGSAELGSEGKNQLNQLANALTEIISKIPPSVKWVLRVDGHTDQLPIHTSQFPSNWELSVARALSVVRYLISKGIQSDKLVAAGFGEHQPLVEGKTESDLARNRRIAFKLDHP